MKVISDRFPNAVSVLSDLMQFKDVALTLSRNSCSFSEGAEGRTLPRFMAETSTALKANLVSNFSATFPNIGDMVVNGSGDAAEASSFERIHNALYAFNDVQRVLVRTNCVLMKEEDRSYVHEHLCDVVADIVVFTCIQFGLYRMAKDGVMRGVQEYCERAGVTPDVLHGMLLQDLRGVNRSWYAWESMSPMCTALNEFDPVFAAECSESWYPLSDAVASSLIYGEVDVAYVRGIMSEHLKQMEEKEVSVTPASLISRMNLK